jgi:hypothetical protein
MGQEPGESFEFGSHRFPLSYVTFSPSPSLKFISRAIRRYPFRSTPRSRAARLEVKLVGTRGFAHKFHQKTNMFAMTPNHTPKLVDEDSHAAKMAGGDLKQCPFLNGTTRASFTAPPPSPEPNSPLSPLSPRPMDPTMIEPLLSGMFSLWDLMRATTMSTFVLFSCGMLLLALLALSGAEWTIWLRSFAPLHSNTFIISKYSTFSIASSSHVDPHVFLFTNLWSRATTSLSIYAASPFEIGR